MISSKIWVIVALSFTTILGCKQNAETKKAEKEVAELQSINQSLDTTILNIEEENLDMEKDVDSLLNGI